MAEQRTFFDVTREGNVLIVSPRVELSLSVALWLNEQMTEALAHFKDPTVTGVVFDVEKTTYFTSDFIGLLLKFWKRVQANGGQMALCHVSEDAQEVLKVCGLGEIWPIVADRAHALALVSRPTVA